MRANEVALAADSSVRPIPSVLSDGSFAPRLHICEKIAL